MSDYGFSDGGEDDFLSYELGKELPHINFDLETAPPKKDTAADKKKKDDLGVEEAVKVVRAPKPKVDATLLLSKRGIPLLQETAPKKLLPRLKRVKGEEWKDARRILEFYQIWADGMYPKARFRDVLALIEKEGRGRRLKVARKEWVNEARGLKRKVEDVEKERLEAGKDKEKDAAGEGAAGEGEKTKPKETTGNLFFSDDEELYEPPPQRTKTTETTKEGNLFLSDGDDDIIPTSSRPKAPARVIHDDDDFDMDDLDAMMEADRATAKPSQVAPSQPISTAPTSSSRTVVIDDDDFDMDALDAMMEAEEATRKAAQPASSAKPPPKPTQDSIDDYEPDDDELEAMMAAENAARVPSATPAAPPKPSQSEQQPSEKMADDYGEPDDDELEAMMAAEAAAVVTPKPTQVNKESSGGTATTQNKAPAVEEDFGDDDLDMDDLDVLMAAEKSAAAKS